MCGWATTEGGQLSRRRRDGARAEEDRDAVIREDVDVNGCDYDETRERRRKRSRVATESGPGRVLGDLGEGDAHLVRADGPRALVGTHGCVEV